MHFAQIVRRFFTFVSLGDTMRVNAQLTITHPNGIVEHRDLAIAHSSNNIELCYLLLLVACDPWYARTNQLPHLQWEDHDCIYVMPKSERHVA